MTTPADFLTVENAGQDILRTNYWDLEHAKRGFFFISVNAGCVRLLVPETQLQMIPEFETGEYVILSRGPWPAQGRPDAIEILFEDFSDSPFALHLTIEQCDMLPDGIGDWTFAVWTQQGLQFSRPLKYRRVKQIPCLKPWKD